MRYSYRLLTLICICISFVSAINADIWDYAREDDYEFTIYNYKKGYEYTTYCARHGKLLTFDLIYEGFDMNNNDFSGQSPIRILRETDPETHLYTNNFIMDMSFTKNLIPFANKINPNFISLTLSKDGNKLMLTQPQDIKRSRKNLSGAGHLHMEIYEWEDDFWEMGIVHGSEDGYSMIQDYPFKFLSISDNVMRYVPDSDLTNINPGLHYEHSYTFRTDHIYSILEEQFLCFTKFECIIDTSNLNVIQNDKAINYSNGKIITSEDTTIDIFDMQGCLISSSFGNYFDISFLNKGLYIVKTPIKTLKIRLQ